MALPNPRLFRGYVPDPRRRQIQVVISQEKFAVNSFEDVLEQRRLQNSDNAGNTADTSSKTLNTDVSPVQHIHR